MTTLYICGAGNSEGVRLALTINQKSRRWDEIYLLDDDIEKHGKSILGVPILGSFSLLEEVNRSKSEAVNMVARGADKRLAARRSIEKYEVPFAGLVHPEVDLCGVELASDAIVYRNAVLGPETCIEEGSVVFMGAIVGHESRVGKHCIIAPNAILNARVILGEGVYVGPNATIIPEIRVGAGATIGVGSAVVHPVEVGETVMGVPAEVVCRKPNPQRASIFFPNKVNGTKKDGNGSISKLRHDLSSNTAGYEDPTPSTAPRNENERILVSIWQKIFNAENIDIHRSFFDYGGNSLKAMELMARIQETFGFGPSMAEFFNQPTIEKLSQDLLHMQIENADEEKVASALTFLDKLSDEEVERLLKQS